MEKRDIIVVGASAGGVNALMDFVKSLPEDLAASVFVVLHTAPYSPSHLPAILQRGTSLEVMHPVDGQKMQHGEIYVAPPDHHLLLDKDSRIIIRKGPKENRFRPSVDALFRSASYLYTSRVIGIVLSGLLDDGTSGMWTIKRNGGVAIVQKPEEAIYPSMPNNVLEHVEVDHILAVDEMGAVMVKVTEEKCDVTIEQIEEELKLLKLEVLVAHGKKALELGILNAGKLSVLTCPECKGALVQINEGKSIRFRCHTGHGYTSNSLLASITNQVEEKLSETLRAFEETILLLKQIGEHYLSLGNKIAAEGFFFKVKDLTTKSFLIHDLVLKQELLSEDQRFDN